MEWYVRALRKYAEFTGRAHRREYWMFVLWNVVFSLALSIVDRAAGLVIAQGEYYESGLLGTIYALAILVPGLAVTTRRLHDTGRSGWWQLLALIPLVGAIILIVWLALQGDTGPNRYGADPRLAPPG